MMLICAPLHMFSAGSRKVSGESGGHGWRVCLDYHCQVGKPGVRVCNVVGTRRQPLAHGHLTSSWMGIQNSFSGYYTLCLSCNLCPLLVHQHLRHNNNLQAWIFTDSKLSGEQSLEEECHRQVLVSRRQKACCIFYVYLGYRNTSGGCNPPFLD